MKIYLASPLGFSEAGRAFYNVTFKPMLIAAGFELLDPWTLTDPAQIEAIFAQPPGAQRMAAFAKINAKIGKANAGAIDECDGMLAVLDGADVDSGTASEIGYACARSKPIVGYRGDFRLSADNEGGFVNLQVEHFVRASGGSIVTKLTAITPALHAALASKTAQPAERR